METPAAKEDCSPCAVIEDVNGAINDSLSDIAGIATTPSGRNRGEEILIIRQNITTLSLGGIADYLVNDNAQENYNNAVTCDSVTFDEEIHRGSNNCGSTPPERNLQAVLAKYRYWLPLSKNKASDTHWQAGGQGKVCTNAIRCSDDAAVAIKITSLTGLDEAALLMHLQHPNIVRYIEHFNDGPTAYLLMELLRGSNLQHYIERRGVNDEEKLKQIVRQINSALVYLHSLDIVHRDIKPANVVFRDLNCNVAVVVDFGSAIRISPLNINSNAMAGTAAYVAPEVLKACSNDPKRDVWALGIVCYQMATGNVPPFAQGDNIQAIFYRICMSASNQDYLSALESKELTEFLQLLLTTDVSRRPSASKIADSEYLYQRHKISKNSISGDHHNGFIQEKHCSTD